MKTESGSIGGIHCSKPFWEQMQAYCVTCESLVGFRFLSNSSTRLHSRHHSANHSSHSLCPSYQKKKKGFVVCFNGWQKKRTELRNKTSMMVKWFFITALFLDSKAFYTAFKCIGDSVFLFFLFLSTGPMLNFHLCYVGEPTEGFLLLQTFL